MKSPHERGHFEGVTQIVRFNWTKYAASLVVIGIGVALLLVLALPPLLWWVVLLGTGLAGYLTIASLAASHWIYDRSGIYELKWLRTCIADEPQRWIAVHAGLDETSTQAQRVLGTAPLAVLDIYDAQSMSEPSIERARRLAADDRSTPARHDHLPIENAACDVALVIFAAHELRAESERAAFFAEIRRSLQHSGRLVLVEHLRDTANWLVFGHGALHFWSRRSWMRALEAGGLRLVHEQRHTPFVRVFAAEPVGSVDS